MALENLSDDELRIKVLELIGWTNFSRTGRRGEDGPQGALRGTSPDGKPNRIAPNPVKNLNAIHDIIMSLPEDGSRDDINLTLAQIVQVSFDYSDMYNLDLTINAGPRERCIAFIAFKTR